jgi:hypothetical protein
MANHHLISHEYHRWAVVLAGGALHILHGELVEWWE